MAIVLDGSNLITTGVINSLTAQNSTSGTYIDFTGIPAGVKRVTVLFNAVSTSGTSHILIQIGSGSITSSGYNTAAGGCINNAAPAVSSSTAGFILFNDTVTDLRSGTITIALAGSNIYVESHTLAGSSSRITTYWGGGQVTLGGALDRVRITTANGTDTFDAGSINVLYE